MNFRERLPKFAFPTLLVTVLLWTGAAWAAVPDAGGKVDEQRNFDARIQYQLGLKSAAPSAAQQAAEEALGEDVPELAVTYEVTGVASNVRSHNGYLTPPNPHANVRALALAFAREHSDLLGLSARDLAHFRVQDEVFSAVTGATHLYMVQTHRGIPLFNGQLHFNVNRDGRIISVNNAFMPDLADTVNVNHPSLRPPEAIAAAAEHLGLTLSEVPEELSAEGDEQQTTRLSPAGISRQDITARLYWLSIGPGETRLMWNLQIQTFDDQHHYDLNVDTETGAVATRFDWTNSGTYRVFDEPDESPLHGSQTRTLVVNPEDATASPNGWFTSGTMDGNNVHACPDANANNACDSNPQCSGTTCDFSLNLSQAPANSMPAAVANLFYWNNHIHDVQYQYGFDEAGGNFQENNFGQGGSGSDSVNADAQDGSGNCNANFSTPTDGGNPRMQMFTCTNASPARDGDFDNGVIVHEYGHGISIRQVGGPGNSSCLNNSQQAGEGWSDWHALVYTAEVGDAGTDSRGIGTYLFGQAPNGPGIRDLPYSTNTAVNNWTYSSIGGAGIPHGIGSRWAQAIWEVYWALVDKHGFSGGGNLLDPVGGGWTGSHRALLYVNEGLKNTACSPTFINNRDGIIQAATDNFGGEDVCDIWQAFADFGLGTDASTGGSNSTTATNGFSVPASCSSPPPAPSCGAGVIDFNSFGTESYADQDISGTVSVADGGDTLVLENNTWRRSLQSFNVTANTVVEFQFASRTQGEIHAIAFDENQTLNDLARHFQFWGTQNWTGAGKVASFTETYNGSGNFQSLSIPVGQTYTGSSMRLVFTNDNDAGSGNEGRFACVRVFDTGGGGCQTNADCDDGLFCNGAETCNTGTGACVAGSAPCTGGQTCNETNDTCEGGGGCLHDVNFEAGAGGWAGGASTCTTGSFIVGTPDATAWQVGGGNPGQAFFTQNNPGGIGTDDVDGGTCEALSPTVNASAESAVSVALDYYHGQRDAGDDVNDGFTIEVLNNGSVVNTLVSIGDVTNNAAWTSVSTTVNNPGNIQIRVRATDAAGAGDIVEGGIDNVQICPTSPPTGGCTVDDDFEAGTAGWFNDAASTCTTGDYVEGNPTNPGGGQQIVGSHSGVASIFTAVNTAAGTNDVDGGNCILGSPTWSVSAASTLSVWYWHGQRDAGDDAAGDFFFLEYSTNGGASWNTLASNGDSASTAAWTNAAAQIPAGSNVALRVQCSDGAAGGDLVECGIDDVSICDN